MQTSGRVFVCVLGALCLAAGACRGPRLASRPLTERQRVWAAAISGDYPAWEPPYMPQLLPALESGFRPAMTTPLLPDLDEFVADPGDVELPLLPPATDEIDLLSFEETDPLPAEPAYETYVVRKGDTLSAISRRYYGTALEWRRLADVNRDVLTAPDQLKPGMVLKIPSLPPTP